MNQPPRIGLIIETSVVYGRRILSGGARYLRSHHRWSVFQEEHELGTRPAGLAFRRRLGRHSQPTDPELAKLFRRMGVPVMDLNDPHNDLGLPWVGSDHRAIGHLGRSICWNAAIGISPLPASAARCGPRAAAKIFTR
jgi:hypothetical protein